jgi:hypothetical protein
MNSANSAATVSANIFDSNGGRGFYDSSATHTSAGWPLPYVLDGNTFYNNGNSGYENSDPDRRGMLINNIFSENGTITGAGAYNAEFNAAAELLYFHAWNVFYHSDDGGSPGPRVSNLTLNAQVGSGTTWGANSEFSTDPQFTGTGTKTFTSGDVNTGTETITITAHGFTAGAVARLTATTGAIPVATGLSLGTPVYIMVTDANNIQLSFQKIAPSAMNFTGAGSGTTTIHCGQAADLSIGSTSPAKAAGFPGQFLG